MVGALVYVAVTVAETAGTMPKSIPSAEVNVLELDVPEPSTKPAMSSAAGVPRP